MTIVEKITQSIEASQQDGFAVYYHDEPTLNLLAGRMTFPCAIVQLLTSGRVVIEGGQAKERVSAAVFFVEPSSFDFDATENETIIDRCKGRAMTWLLALAADQYLRLEEITRTSRVYDRYDDILTGFGVLVELKELNGIC